MPMPRIGWSRGIVPRLLKREATFVDIVRGEGLELALDLMVPFAHWITPERVPKRFDTHFFLIAAPVAQLGAHDGGESVEGLWITPQRALSDAEAGTRTLVFATRMNLTKLARYRTVAEAVSGDALEAGRDGDAEGEAHARRPLAANPGRGRLRRDRGVRGGRLAHSAGPHFPHDGRGCGSGLRRGAYRFPRARRRI